MYMQTHTHMHKTRMHIHTPTHTHMHTSPPKYSDLRLAANEIITSGEIPWPIKIAEDREKRLVASLCLATVQVEQACLPHGIQKGLVSLPQCDPSSRSTGSWAPTL